MIEKYLGIINKVEYGNMDNEHIGIKFDLRMEGGTIGVNPTYTVYTGKILSSNYSDEERTKDLMELQIKILKWLKKARVNFVHELEGITVEVEMENRIFKNFRIM